MATGDLGRAAVARRRQLDAVRAARLVGGRHGGEHPDVALRRLGGRRTARRRLPPARDRPAARDGAGVRRRHGDLRRARRCDDRRHGGTELEGSARRPDRRRLRPRRPRRDRGAGGGADDGHDERLPRRAPRSSMASLAAERDLPRLARRRHRAERAAATARAATPSSTVAILGLLVAGVSSTDDLVRATSACFIAVYMLAVLSAARILTGQAADGRVVHARDGGRARGLLELVPRRADRGRGVDDRAPSIPAPAPRIVPEDDAALARIERAGRLPRFGMAFLRPVQLPVADPGDPDTRSPARLLIWVGRKQVGTLLGGGVVRHALDGRPGVDAVRDRTRDPARDRREGQHRARGLGARSCSCWVRHRRSPA